MLKSLIAALIGIIALNVHTLEAETRGKIDVGPAFMHVDILESGRTVKRMDMWGNRVDLSLFIYKGLYIKPVFLYGNGGSAKGGLFSASTSVGYCLPINEKLLVSPSVGYMYNHLWTRIDLGPMKNLRENFKSWAPFVAFDVYYTFIPTWRVGVGLQYSWSRTSTTIKNVVKNVKSTPEGFTYNFLLEHDLNDKWSVNLGVAYNLSLTKEKHGLRGTGIKLGVVRWF